MTGSARRWGGRLLTGVNVALCLTLLGLMLGRGAVLSPPWDGPAVVTTVLAVATLVLGAVALGVGLLAIWGYSAIRGYAEQVAAEAAQRAATAAAEIVVERMLREWGVGTAAPGDGDEIAQAYAKEDNGGR